LAAIRGAGYWIVNATNMVKGIISKCIICIRFRKQPEQQQMGELPIERLEKTAPFTYVGMDVFGHFNVKDRRTELKRWGLLFTCLYSRAVHIELLEDLSTDAFINALRSFVAIRGPVQILFSDQGTNFMGAKNEFRKQLNMATDEKLKAYLVNSMIEFRTNSPEASHQGGTWERMIRSVRAVLNSMAAKYKWRLDTQTLRTAFLEAAAIINSRPLTATDINNPEETIITPNHLLTMKSKQLCAPPPGKFENNELYGRARWKIAQRLAEEFWVAWKSEYFRHLTIRPKWNQASQNVKKGDIILLKDDDVPRNIWKLGVVEETEAGKDGLVRNVLVRLANCNLDQNGRPLSAPSLLKRPIQKLVVVFRC
jgi:hypothetical protein